MQQKNQYKITLDEARELLRLLLRNNPMREFPLGIPERHCPQTPGVIDVDFESSQSGRLRYEGWLNAWFMRSFTRGELKDFFGDYREFLNLVPTTFNKVMDVFLTHVTSVDSIDVLHKYTCIELKADRATEQDLTQLLRYEEWLARKLAGGDNEMIQSVLVAARFADGVIDYVRSRRQIEDRTVRLLSYRVADDKRGINLTEEPKAACAQETMGRQLDREQPQASVSRAETRAAKRAAPSRAQRTG